MLNAMLAQGIIAATYVLVLIAMCSDLQFVWRLGVIQLSRSCRFCPLRPDLKWSLHQAG